MTGREEWTVLVDDPREVELDCPREPICPVDKLTEYETGALAGASCKHRPPRAYRSEFSLLRRTLARLRGEVSD